jgi:hypothetical protein
MVDKSIHEKPEAKHIKCSAPDKHPDRRGIPVPFIFNKIFGDPTRAGKHGLNGKPCFIVKMENAFH